MSNLQPLILVLLFLQSFQFSGIVEPKPADVQQYQRSKYLQILNGPQVVYDSCQPFYKRVFYNIDNIPSGYKKTLQRDSSETKHSDWVFPDQIISDQNMKTSQQQKGNIQSEEPFTEAQQPLDMFIYFNTNISCPKSYITVQLFSTKIMKFNCVEQLLHLEANGTKWQQYVHKCRILILNNQAIFIDAFKYTIYGQALDLEDQKETNKLTSKELQNQKKKAKSSQTIQIQVVRKQISTKMIVLGDWAPIKVRPYFPIYQSLVNLIDLRKQEKKIPPFKNQYRITALVIAGDIAYNLEDFNGMKYNWFMSQLQKVSPYWPIIIFPGNHDDYTEGNRYLLSHSFQIGRLSVEDNNFTRVKWMRFPNLVNFIIFDPFLEIYNAAKPEQAEQMVSYLKATIEQVQNKYPNQFSVIMSHYPVACSQLDDDHCSGMMKRNTTKYLLDFMSTQRDGKPRPIDFFIGSHMHQFERVFPYINGTFEIGQKSKYQRGHMVSVVQGAAGCDYGIIDQDFPRMNFSVSATFNKTGYGIMTINGTSELIDKSKYSLNYRHVAASPAPQYYQNIDQFTIYGKLLQASEEDILNQIYLSVFDKIKDFDQKLQLWQQYLEQILASQ